MNRKTLSKEARRGNLDKGKSCCCTSYIKLPTPIFLNALGLLTITIKNITINYVPTMKAKQLRFGSVVALWTYLVLTISLIGCNHKVATSDRGIAISTHIVSQAPQAKNIPSKEQQIAQSNQQPYLDDRSTPIQVLKSYYNAINRQEYVRAYSYWGQKGTGAKSQPPAYQQFAAGYSNTTQVKLTTGKARGEGAAGSVYTTVPVTLSVTNINGSKDTFVGCYTLRQVNPKLFSVPPFTAIHIESANIRKIADNENAVSLMKQSCTSQ